MSECIFGFWSAKYIGMVILSSKLRFSKIKQNIKYYLLAFRLLAFNVRRIAVVELSDLTHLENRFMISALITKNNKNVKNI